MLNIYQRLNEVRKAVGYIQKDKTVETYKAVTHDQVTAHVRKALIDQGVITVMREISRSVQPTGTVTKSGTPFIRFEAVYEIDFVNIDLPDDRTTMVMSAHAIDHGDKAPGKTHSYVKKYAVLKILDMETGEDDESRVAAEPEAMGDEEFEIHRLAMESAVSKEALEDAWKKAVAACKSHGTKLQYDLLKDVAVAAGKKFKETKHG